MTRPRRGRFWVIAIVAVLALGLAGVAAVVRGGDEGYPDAWDEGVADVAAFVEDERRLDFEHPVRVVFMQEDEFRNLVTRDKNDLNAEERKEIEDNAAKLRAVGLMGDEADLFESSNDLSRARVLALYDSGDQLVRVRGTQLTSALRATLAHELTHALQNQHFDLGRLHQRRPGDEDFGGIATLRALVEGDAERVEAAYVESLDPVRREEVRDARAEREAVEPDVEDVPPILAALFAAPFELGRPLASIVVEAGGLDALDDTLRQPPTSDESLIDPFALLDDDGPETVDSPSLERGAQRIDGGAFGALGWYLVLAARIDATRALAAADGWGGDSYVVYREGGPDARVCVRIAYRGERPTDVDELAAALDDWVGSIPQGAARVSRQDESGLLFESCEPRSEAAVPRPLGAMDIIGLPVARSRIVARVLAQGASVEQARCFATQIRGALTPDQVAAAATWNRIQELALGCP